MLQLPETAKLQPRPTCITAHSGASKITSPRMESDAVAQPQPLLCLQPCALVPSGAAGTAAAHALISTFWSELQGCPRACAHLSPLCRGLHTGCVHSRLAPYITDSHDHTATALCGWALWRPPQLPPRTLRALPFPPQRAWPGAGQARLQ